MALKTDSGPFLLSSMANFAPMKVGVKLLFSDAGDVADYEYIGQSPRRII